VINESLANQLTDKDLAASIGKMLYWNDKPYPVVGVVADFHTKSLHEKVTPSCIINRRDREGAIAVKLGSEGNQRGMIKTTLSSIEKSWKEIYPAGSFQFRFYDETLALLYEEDRQTAKLVNVATVITIFISCIGLFGLALFTAERRTKEISIRKILGATPTGIAAMLSKDFVLLAVMALLIASPIAWYFSFQWLQSFAYRIHFSWWIILLAGVTVILITLMTVSMQAIRAAVADPAKSLRSE
jgi:ABC-type antimicrobial peptide transport system permease subunit